MLSNYQMRTLGGEGYLRVLQIQPSTRALVVRTYSVLYDSLLAEPDQSLDLTLEF
jgi:hypothetical protein